jgi:UDP-galactopyranose mutase
MADGCCFNLEQQPLFSIKVLTSSASAAACASPKLLQNQIKGNMRPAMELIFRQQDEAAHDSSERLPDLICLSHLRWDFVYQRPQHLMSRFAAERRVFYVEEPVFQGVAPRLEVQRSPDNVCVVTPFLPSEHGETHVNHLQEQLLNELLEEQNIQQYVLWYYTPAALRYSRHLRPLATLYDCMDELSLFLGAPAELRQQELELFARADLVFAGGPSLYESKRKQHGNVHLFPSSIDTTHFGQARYLPEPPDQAHLPHPRLGFFGVIDERLDIALLQGVAEARPDWQLVLIGPVVKIDPACLPQRENIHYLGKRSYQELPAYLGGWDVALLPFALNEATRFISPTKTPEYLAGGKPVVSTPIRDVIQLYGEVELVHIAESVTDYVAAIEVALERGTTSSDLDRVDGLLAQNSWDCTWLHMRQLLDEAASTRKVS